MLDNIKSAFFIKNIFSFFNEKEKLELITYNKKLQNLLKINITNYKFFSGKYKIGNKNGKGQEFNGSNEQLYLKVNIKMEKEMEKEKNMIALEKN